MTNTWIYRCSKRFDRETKREKIIEGKIREQKLKNAATGKTDTAVAERKLAESEAQMLQEVEKEFSELINVIVSILFSLHFRE